MIMMVNALNIVLVGAALYKRFCISSTGWRLLLRPTSWSKTQQVGLQQSNISVLCKKVTTLQNVCSPSSPSLQTESIAVAPASLSFNLNCEYLDTTCGAGGRTWKPVIALSPADGGVLSAAACVKDFERDGIALGDTCISVDLVRMHPIPCDCTVTFDDQICDSCTVCGEGRGLALDCGNVNAEVTTECRKHSI
jgi:hypothetical protein